MRSATGMAMFDFIGRQWSDPPIFDQNDDDPQHQDERHVEVCRPAGVSVMRIRHLCSSEAHALMNEYGPVIAELSAEL
jgi:hypothetical protein